MARKITKAEAKAILAKREYESKRPWNALDALTGPDGNAIPWQVDFHNDTSRFRALTGTRQSGKTTLDAVEGIDTCLLFPRTESIFVDITVDHAIEVLFPEVERLLREFRIPAVLRDDHLAFDNGSVFHAMGLSTVAEAKKLQGHRFKLGIFDEMTDLAANVDEAFAMIAPALARHEGRLIAQGIPGPVLAGIWYDICEGNQKHLYSQHRCSIMDNPWIPNAQAEVDRERLRLGGENPLFRRHWLGQWAYDPDALVYRYRPEKNGSRIDAPKCRYYVAGLDPAGVADREALVLLGFGNGDGKIYHVAESVSPKGGVDDFRATANVLGKWHDRYKLTKTYYDYGSAKKGLQLMYRQDCWIQLDPVPVKDLDVEIPRVNSLLNSGKLVIQEGSELEKDLQKTQWDDKARAAGRNKYSSHNHPDVADALRAALQAVAAVEPDAVETPSTPEQIERADVAKLFERQKSYAPVERNNNPYSRNRR